MNNFDCKYTMKCRDFLFSWTGNKDREIQNIINFMTDNNIDIDKYTNIIESFGGSFSFIRFLKRQGINKTYIVNDIDNLLIDCYKTMSDPLQNKITINLIHECTKDIDKEKYKQIINENNVKSYILKHSYYNIRPGLFPSRTTNINFDRLSNFVSFSDINFMCVDWMQIIETYKDDDKTFIFLDPPYFLSCNDAYSHGLTDIFFDMLEIFKSYKCRIIGVINYHKLISTFMTYNGISHVIHDVTYTSSKKKVKHIYFTNI